MQIPLNRCQTALKEASLLTPDGLDDKASVWENRIWKMEDTVMHLDTMQSSSCNALDDEFPNNNTSSTNSIYQEPLHLNGISSGFNSRCSI